MPKTSCTTLALGRQAGAASLAAPPVSGGGLCSTWQHAGEVASRHLWPFLSTYCLPVRESRREGAPACGEASRGDSRTLPVGNHGEYLRSVQK